MDLAAKQQALDLLYSADGFGDLTVELWVGHEDAGGVEVTGDGYAPGDLPATGWEPADSEGVKESSDMIACGTTPGDAWSGTVTHYVLRSATFGSCGCFPLPVTDRLTVGGPGLEPVKIKPRVFIGQREDD